MGKKSMPIKLDHVFHIYAQKTPFQFEALQDVSLTIHDQSFTAIIGHTGSGKSTLIQHFNALLVPTSGSLTVNNILIQANKVPKKVKSLRQHAGVVFQFPEAQLFEESVLQDVMFGPLNFGKTKTEATQLASQALNQVGLNQSFYQRSPFELSGGERRRVAIAGILAIQPKVLILDEPTAGLDPEGASEMMSLFTNLHRQGMTIIMVTHDMELVYQFATHVIVMAAGKVRLETTPNELFFKHHPHISFTEPPLVTFLKTFDKLGKPLPLHNIRSLQDFHRYWGGK